MFQRSILFFLLSIGSILTLSAQGDPLPGVGARVVGLGNAYTAVRGNIWSLFHNPSTITGSEGVEAGAYFEQRFFLPELTFGNAGIIVPLTENQSAGLSVGTNGFSGYRENQTALTYAITVMDKISLGASANLATVAIPNLGTAVTFFIDFGAHVQLSEELSVGASVYNTTRASVETLTGTREYFPTIITGGISYQPSKQVLIVADVQKDVDRPVSFRGGVEYALNEILYARLGVSTAPLTLTGGIGINYRDFSFDFAISYTELLQVTPHASLNYRFGS